MREFGKSRIERQQLIACRNRFLDGIVERHAPNVISAALARMAAARCFDQKLPHRARGNALEMEPRCGGETRGGSEFEPGLVDQNRGAERGAWIAAPNRRGQAAQ